MKKIDFETLLPIVLLVISFVIFMFFKNVFISMLLAGIGVYYSFYTKQIIVGISNISVVALDVVVLIISLIEIMR